MFLAAAGFILSAIVYGRWWEALTATDVAAWVTGLATIGLALVAVRQSGQAKRQIEISNRNVSTAELQAESAEASVEAALNVHAESIRARADQFAPRVVAFYEEPESPLMDSLWNGMPRDAGLRLLAPDSLQRAKEARGHEFIFPETKGAFLWFHGRALLVNEGPSSARVRLPDESIFIEGKSWLDGVDIGIPAVTQEGPSASAILPPGGRAMFRWAAGHTVDEWAHAYLDNNNRSPKGDFWLWITVFDSREVGVVDTMLAHFQPAAIAPVPGREGHWRVPDSEDFGLVNPIPTRRNYVHEGKQTEDLSQRDAYYRGEDI